MAFRKPSTFPAGILILLLFIRNNRKVVPIHESTCERDKLLHAFQMAASVAPSRSPKPILQNVKLEVTADGAILMGTDLEVGIRVEVPGFTVRPRHRGPAPRPLWQDSGRKLRREAGLGERRPESAGPRPTERVPTSLGEPRRVSRVVAFEEKKYHEMPARFFREVVRRTVYATDNESSRYALGGVLLEFIGQWADGRGHRRPRLARQEGPAKSVGGHVSGDNMTIIPTRAMQLLERALADNEENIQLAARENDVLVKSGRATIYSRLVEGRYPKWRDVFPRREGCRRSS